MRVRKSAEDRKAEIVQAALALAFEVGPEGVTTGMIADCLGLTQPAIYKHFPRKDDIWRSATRTLSGQITANIEDATNRDETPIKRLRRLILGHLQLVHATPALPEFMVARDPKGAQNAVRDEIMPAMTGFFNELADAIKAAQSDGSFRTDIDATDLATLIFGVIQSLVLRMMVTRDPSVLLANGERLLDLQLSAFTQRQGEIE
ncbi:MAG: TetR/AcrR family transcriptional regulator [Rhodobacteraceae bacterium]|nr:TetR/AcrR family transcriptional regulator [Paracoccaceae bacterium]